ncbi:MAG: hypothetical protein HY321_02100 [Armatimonadetes bacterium]|nr:hypothetical protein [Armatimonadota bacterium]
MAAGEEVDAVHPLDAGALPGQPRTVDPDVVGNFAAHWTAEEAEHFFNEVIAALACAGAYGTPTGSPTAPAAPPQVVVFTCGPSPPQVAASAKLLCRGNSPPATGRLAV